MKGTLHKTEQGWVVNSFYEIPTSIPLHPKNVRQIEEDAKVFDNIEARIAAYSEVEFDIVTEWPTGEVGVNGLTFAKLIDPDQKRKIDLQKLEAKLDKLLSEETPESFHKWLEGKRGPIRTYHSPKVDEMLKEIEEDNIKDWAHLTSVSKGLDGSVYQSTYEQGFIEGYKKAKSTLYTEDQVRKAIEDARDIISHVNTDEVIKSLKQPK